VSVYVSDEELIIHLHDMARKYDSSLLRTTADRMCELIKENKRHEHATRMETMGHRKFT